MRYHYEKPKIYKAVYGTTYACGQQTWWNEIDPWLVDALYLHPKFIEFFNERGGKPKDGIYPTVSIRQIMWALKMKPLKRERWETSFDRRLI